jgi:uncharacterized membrane protein YfcA
VTWQFSLTGLLIGVLVGLTGMGGGSLMTPILILFFGFKPTYAVGTDILHGAIFKTFGAVRHRKLGTVHARLALWMFAGSGPMSLAGIGVAAILAHYYGDSAQSVEAKAIGAALLLGGAGLFAKAFLRGRPDGARELAVLSRRDKQVAFWLGFTGGFIVGLTSVGSGTFFGLVMLLVYPLAARRIVGTDIFHAAALLWVAGFGYLALGKVDLHAMAWLLVGSIPGVLIGSQLGVGLPDRPLRAALATTLVLSGVKIVGAPESSWIIVGALIAGTLALAAWKLAQREARQPVTVRAGD